MRLELRRVSMTTPRARDARRSWPERQLLRIRISDARGDYGLGEASPLPGYSRDSLDDVEAALSNVDVAELERRLEAGLSVGSWQLAVATLGHVAALTPRELPSARMALETAALDYLSRRRGVSAPRWLGATQSATVRLSCLVGGATDADLWEHVEQAGRDGYSHFKVKVGKSGAFHEELAQLVALRTALGPPPSLRLDANGVLTAAELLEGWPLLHTAGIELFEEPGELPDGLRGELPLALDESLIGLTPAEASYEVARKGAMAVVLKPTTLGGIAHCLAVARSAESRGAGVVISHCFEGALAFRAAAALALALPSGLAHGLAPHSGLDASALPIEAGSLRAWSEAGLGEPGGFEA